MTKVKLIDDVGNFYSFISGSFILSEFSATVKNKINGLLESRCQQHYYFSDLPNNCALDIINFSENIHLHGLIKGQ